MAYWEKLEIATLVTFSGDIYTLLLSREKVGLLEATTSYSTMTHVQCFLISFSNSFVVTFELVL